MGAEIKIGRKVIKDGGDVFIIAEAGVNHEGSFETALKMVEVAAQAGADAVTFQHVIDSELNIKKGGPSNLAWERWMLKDEQLKELFVRAKSKGLLCTACVIDRHSIDKIVSWGADFFKIVSGDITSLPFIGYCAQKKLPVFLSTGAASLGEIEAAVGAVKAEGNSDIVLYHTNSHYPTPPQEINLKALVTLKSAFSEVTGFCDHTEGYLAPLVACVLGASVIEKHFTLDRSKKGADYQVSLEPDELKAMVRQIRDINVSLGSPLKQRLDSEQATYRLARRSIVARTGISKGVRITEEMLTFKRPGTGICPSLLAHVVGKAARLDIKEDEMVLWNALEDGTS
ncbi:MAG: N-acetylneuraminate synthase family protein [Candidatus Omnitrophica bacterium]|nr:N-acetylneuraminate synthase family protein [Candidatus Omnitrophota bacterium]